MSPVYVIFAVLGMFLLLWMARRAVDNPEEAALIQRAIRQGKVDETARSLVGQGKSVLAVRLLREAHGISPGQALDIVATMDPVMARQRLRRRGRR